MPPGKSVLAPGSHLGSEDLPVRPRQAFSELVRLPSCALPALDTHADSPAQRAARRPRRPFSSRSGGGEAPQAAAVPVLTACSAAGRADAASAAAGCHLLPPSPAPTVCSHCRYRSTLRRTCASSARCSTCPCTSVRRDATLLFCFAWGTRRDDGLWGALGIGGGEREAVRVRSVLLRVNASGLFCARRLQMIFHFRRRHPRRRLRRLHRRRRPRRRRLRNIRHVFVVSAWIQRMPALHDACPVDAAGGRPVAFAVPVFGSIRGISRPTAGGAWAVIQHIGIGRYTLLL